MKTRLQPHSLQSIFTMGQTYCFLAVGMGKRVVQ